MGVEIVTKADLEEFRLRLICDLEAIIAKHVKPSTGKKWLRSHEILKMFDISSGTLQNLLNSGTLQRKKMGGLNYFDYEEIEKILNKDDKKTSINRSSH